MLFLAGGPEESGGQCLDEKDQTIPVDAGDNVPVLKGLSKETCLSGCLLVDGATGCAFNKDSLYLKCFAIKRSVTKGDGTGGICWKFNPDKGKS